MKRITILITLMLVVGFLPISASAFSKEAENFDRIWYHPTDGFKNEGNK